MLAVFENSIGKPPEELRLPSTYSQTSKTREEIARKFQSSWPESTFYNFSNGNCMALSHENETPLHPRSIVVMDDVFSIFIGNLENICDLRRHYGLCRLTTEAMLVIEMYKVLRDRAPYPSDQVIKDFVGKFAFILFDAKYGTLFAARDRDGSVHFQLGMSADGSLVCSDDPNIISEACGRSSAVFPPGCFFKNGNGLVSFDHPFNKVRAVAHEDDDGHISVIIFKVDLYTRIPSIPRTGSSANWADTAMIGE
ncbi:hypothetical protein AQUCO_02300195v1 [Aquilegia coerulea]|uniref:DUF3700 domain-containing protein n=1 Tax=Aquilegia coerulea TaxID=218851 RepID=A0A2G5DCS6_AQUCA|nr:hypothetical protein AQUCO_02300195v1 [Aquilegia coerulea]PIA41263.1 hypothetical protein AQUCO_02300195v1 [Aquilegia coerulea]PIA41264.1 hypothetical protein AQUCO_02300195v1 [Aquilegia coerulea]